MTPEEKAQVREALEEARRSLADADRMVGWDSEREVSRIDAALRILQREGEANPACVGCEGVGWYHRVGLAGGFERVRCECTKPTPTAAERERHARHASHGFMRSDCGECLAAPEQFPCPNCGSTRAKRAENSAHCLDSAGCLRRAEKQRATEREEG